MRFDRLTLDQGLSQSSVISIRQDAEGFMWFGTENGLNRFDGYDFTHFRRERGNAEALRSDFVFGLVETPDGRLWAATNGGGLASLDKQRKTVTSYVNDPADSGSIGGNVIRALLLDATGHLWLGFRDAGLDRFDPATGAFSHIDLGTEASVFALHQDVAGNIWVGADKGLFRIDAGDGSVKYFRHDPTDQASLSGDQVRAVYEDHLGNLWVGTRGAGLNRFDPRNEVFEHFRHDTATADSISSDRVTAILEDNAKRLWVGTTDGLNLVLRDTGKFARFLKDTGDAASLGGNSIASLYQDRTGVLWVGTLTGGVSKWNPRTWGLGFEAASSLTADAEVNPNVTAFATDNADTLWIGTFGDGLIARNRESGASRIYRHDPQDPNSISDDRVMSLLYASDGTLWVGTMTGGLNWFDPAAGTNTVYRHDQTDPGSLSADGVMAVFEDSQGKIWVGTFGGGISVFDPVTRSFTNHAADASRAGSLSSNRVTSFAEDARGKIWVGTDAGGLNLFSPDTRRFQTFRYQADNPRSLSEDTVYSLHVDATGTVWVGTRGGGLNRVVGNSESPDQITFENFSQKDGLSNDVIYGIQHDGNGELWLSTNYGINRVNPETGNVRSLHRRDGLQSEEFNFGAHHASRDGELFFGGQNGLNAFKPDELQTNAFVPPVILTGFFKSNSPIKSPLPDDMDKGIELDYRDDTVRFEFAALDYASIQANRYMYKLEGFDDDWVDLGNRRRVTYTDLDNGNYLLRVKAANSDGVWNEVGFAVPVRVAAAPWETWWAYLAYLAMATQLAVFLWLGHRRKIRREEEYSHRLEQEVRSRTAELAQRNVELKDLNRCLQESSLSDPLTGLRNRRFVFEEVSKELASISRKYGKEREGLDIRNAADLVFMMVDLDNFKPINDTFGHAAGDKMLLDIRDVLLGTCRRSDFVVRWGGDEFVIIAKQAHPGESEALAERIRREIESREFQLPDGQLVRTTCSIGFAAFPLFQGQAEGGNLDDVINLADGLMYEAKRQRNSWVGMLGMNEAVTSEHFDLGPIEATSLLFRAKRQRHVTQHREDDSVGYSATAQRRA
ncbi:MAG: diguanylate cyclase [Gammaproteobacteria bacterium]|nr:diguanylate cyclase [Gammaproteobacteria bacterium]